MHLIVFKLILPPLLILAASLAGRRWGDAIGGWLVGLPLTSGPVAAFLAIQYGADFAALATNGSLIGAASQAAFSLAYARLAARGAGLALAAGAVGYFCAALALEAAPLPHWAFFLVALFALTLALWLIPHRETVRAGVGAPWWDLPARMIVATTLVVALTAAAAFVGPKAAGAIASFPVFGAILTLFAHQAKGPVMASQVLRGMLLALFGFAAFFFLLGWLLPTAGILTAFVVATSSTFAAQAAALRLLRRPIAARYPAEPA